MENPELKARALVLSFQMIGLDIGRAKQCAMIVVNEVMAEIPPTSYGTKTKRHPNPKYVLWKDIWEEIEQL